MINPEIRDFVDRVKEVTDIVEIIGQRIPLDSNNMASCPFHKEENPSFSVNSDDQFFHCFGCGEGGDVLKFVMLIDGKTFFEALVELANQSGISIPQFSTEDIEKIRERRDIEDILTETARFYHRCLTPDVRTYLTRARKFSPEIIERFQIGYARGGLKNHLVNQCKFSESFCIKACVLKKEGNRSSRDFFSNRIIFPNYKAGKVVHITGRAFRDERPKYLHLPGEIHYLYNEDALNNKVVFLTEGAPDCITAVQYGYHAVAILGVRVFKPEYVHKFRRCETIYICLDRDRAGEEGALRIGDFFGDKAKIIQLPDGLDLNEYFKSQSREDFETLIHSSENVIRHRLSLIPENIEKIELASRLTPIIKILSRMEKTKIEAYLIHEIKPRFDLTLTEISGYRKAIYDLRREGRSTQRNIRSRQSNKQQYIARFEGLVDLVEQDSKVAFLVKEESQLLILPEIRKEGNCFIPPEKEKIPWILPRGENVIRIWRSNERLSNFEVDCQLYDAILNYLRGISELPSEDFYDLNTAWVLHTHLTEGFQYSPILCLYAVPEKGKTRTGKGMIQISYRGIHVESLREAYILRAANDLGASIFFDVMKIWKKAEKSGSEDILLHRFEKGAKVPRVLYPERGAYRDTVWYEVFGPTIIATNDNIHKILETRAIKIVMPEARRRFENDVVPEDSRDLKEQLVAFRARHLGGAIPDTRKPVSGRLGDILKPLFQVVRLVKPDREEAFLALARDIERERLLEKSTSLEAEILGVVTMLSSEIRRGILAVKTITDRVNVSRTENTRLSPHRVGRRLSAMGFRKARTENGASAILWNEERIQQMMQSYGLLETSETSVTPETPESQSRDTDDTDVCNNPRNRR